jgi:hypothetical protein
VSNAKAICELLYRHLVLLSFTSKQPEVLSPLIEGFANEDARLGAKMHNLRHPATHQDWKPALGAAAGRHAMLLSTQLTWRMAQYICIESTQLMSQPYAQTALLGWILEQLLGPVSV